MSVIDGLNQANAAASGNYSLNDILNTTNTAKQPGAFRRVLGGVIGGAANLFAPGIGSVIGKAISGGISGGGALGGLGGAGGSSLMGDSSQFLQLQAQMNNEQRAFETASNVLKARHDADMAAIQNIH